MSRQDKILNGAAYWGSYYRNNPDKFVEQYLHVKLKLFQRIVICMMFWASTFVFSACRGIGKTFMSAIYCVTRAILYPGTRICIASGTRGQSLLVVEKITQELIPKSKELAAEIKETKMNGTDAYIVFHNTSVIKVVTASDSARGNRCNVLLLDEFRLIDKTTIDTVLRKFLTLRRMPLYSALSDSEKKLEYDKEKNMTMWLTSPYFKSHWSFTRCLDTFKVMFDDRHRQFICGFPYQLSIEEGLLDPELVQDEMCEQDFSEVKFSMEYGALWYGSAEDAFFDFDTVSRNRRIKYPMLPGDIAHLIQATAIRIPPKQNGEFRVLSADIALMSSKRHKNDATSIFINQMLPSKSGRYTSNMVFSDECEGLRTDDQALVIRRLFDEFECDYLVLDTNGIGLGAYDCLAKDIVDPDTGQIYPALSCCNDKTMADRCTVPNARKVIWSIKASAQFNSDCAFLLREGFKSGRIRLLETEYDAEDNLKELKGYQSLNQADRVKFELPYIHTTLLIDELTKLEHEESGGRVKVYERAGMRKDRYSSISYNYYVANQIEQQAAKRQINVITKDSFVVKPPKYSNGKAVNSYGVRGWDERSWNR